MVYESRNNEDSPYTVYTLANGMLISQRDTYGSLYFLSDAQGSTRALTDGISGNVASQFSYDAFGNLDESIAPSTLATHYLYTGQQFDPATELYSLRARYYDPSIGRFTSRDTWAYDYGNPVELNRYVYAQGNPTRYSDPSGYMFSEDGLNFSKTLQISPKALLPVGLTVAVAVGFVIILFECISHHACTPSYSAQFQAQEAIKSVHNDILRFLNGIKNVEAGVCGQNFNWRNTQTVCYQPTNAPTPTATSTPRIAEHHIALGLNEGGYLLSFWGGLRGFYQPKRIKVHMFGLSWTELGASSSSIDSLDLFDVAFFAAAPTASRIHFNLEGISGDYVDFMNNWSNNGQFLAGQARIGSQFSVTAWELWQVRSSYCGKTYFYEQGSTNLVPSLTAGQRICGLTYALPSGDYPGMP